MSFPPKLTTTILLLSVIVVLLPVQTYAFGAGDIPDFSYLNDKAFRHGDIENILETLVKYAGGAASGGGLLGLAHSVLSAASGGAKFSKSDIKKVYFGNWLRDYSQAMDIAGLTKLTPDSIILIISVLGFMTFGFATEEFQVTADRLGVYLPVEHIDNPKGYAAAEGDARRVNPKLRPPVDERELEIDERTGMKNYMASENQGWDTSTAFIRRTFRACIEAGRRAGGREGADLWEAYRLLGTGMHTMEDLLAHSNWCEIALRKMGHKEVFCHVGDNVVVNTPNGPAPPLVTGSFGGADFIHSLMGEATDHLSQSSVTDLTQKMNEASQGDNKAQVIKDILSKLPIGGGDDKMSQGEQIQAQSQAYNFDPDNIAPPEVQQQLLDLLKWRDGVYRDVVKTIEMVPGLEDLVDQLSLALNAYVYTIISPYIVPILQQATGVLGEGSKAVIDTSDQYEVFNNPSSSDPTHSFLAKDHFALILNEPAGKIAQIVVENTVNLLVPAWSNNSNPDQVIDQILEAFHHPYYASGRSRIQHLMFEHMERWLGGLGPEETRTVIQALTKESVRNGTNKRPGSEDESEPGAGGHSHGATSGGYGKQQRQDQYGSGQYGGSRTESSYGQSGHASGQHRKDDSSNTYGSSQGRNNYGETQNQGGYGGRRTEDTYGQIGHSSGQHRKDDSSNTYGSGQGQNTYGETQNQGGYGGRRTEDTSYGSSTYGEESQRSAGRHSQDSSYPRRDDESTQRSTYGESKKESEYGSRRSDNDSYGRAHRGESEREQGYQGASYGQSGSHKERTSHSTRDSRREDEYGSSGHSRNEGESYGRIQTNPNLTGVSNEYGGVQYGGRTTEERTYGSSGRVGDEYGSSGYGGGGRSEGYGGGSRRTEEDSYGSKRAGDQYSSSGYGQGGQSDEYGGGRGGRTTEESYGSSGRGGNEYGSSGYGGREGQSEGYGGGGGYAPSYGGRDDTFGAERLNISGGRDRDDDDGRGEQHHGHGRRHRKHDSDD